MAGSENTNEGRVEVLSNGTWGTVCNDGFDITDATVVCRQLGFVGAAGIAVDLEFGAGTGDILMDEVQCSGTEERLQDCHVADTSDINCVHSEDAGVICATESGTSKPD